MSTQVPQNQDVNLSQISKSISNFFESVKTSVFNAIQFFVRNWIIVLLLIIIGFGLGYYLDKNRKGYNNEIIVSPNFGSVDYLYSKIDLLESKIESGDDVFLKGIGIKDPENLKAIKIKPVADTYNFIINKPENFELLKLLAEDGDVNKVIVDNVTSKNYTFQKVIISTTEKTSEEKVIRPILSYLNDSEYFKKIQKEVYKNTVTKITQNDSIIKQIDGILNNFSNESKYSSKSDKLLYNNENAQLNDIIKTKDLLLNEQGSHRIELIGFDKIIKESSIAQNIEYDTVISGKLKFLLPLLFILFFLFVKGFSSFYKNQKLKTTTV